MLVASFQIQIGRPSQFFPLLQHGIMRRTRIKPYIHCIGQFVVIFAIFRTQQFTFIQGKPCLNAFFLNALGHFLQQPCRIGMQFARIFMHEKGHRRTPEPLARNHPIRTAFNHRLQTRAAPCREKFGIVHSLQRFVAQGFTVRTLFIHTDKPLAGSTVNQGGFVPPTMGITVFDFVVRQQPPYFLKPSDNHRVGFPNRHALNARCSGNITPLCIYRVKQLDAVFDADEIIFQTVRRRSMNQARTGLGTHMFAVQQQNIAI